MGMHFPPLSHNSTFNASNRQQASSQRHADTAHQTSTATPQGSTNTTSDAAQNAGSFWMNAPRTIFSRFNTGRPSDMPAATKNALQTEALIHPAIREQIEDLKTILMRQNPNRKVPLLVKQKDPDLTEFFLDLEEENLDIPEHINQKFTEDEVKSIYFMVPNEALPPGGLEGRPKAIRQWLGLPRKVHFEVFPKQPRQRAQDF